MSTERDEIGELLDTYYNQLDGNKTLHEYHERHGTESALILTNFNDERAGLVADWLRPKVEGKVVVEIGAGIGLLAMHLAPYTKRLYAIEVDPAWTSIFLWQLYAKKPKNLTFIFGAADEAPEIKADLAFFCTHSGIPSMRAAAYRFAPIVVDVYEELLPPDKRREGDRCE